MRIVVISGGLGYLGSTLSNVLVNRGFRVISIDLASNPTYIEPHRNYISLHGPNYDLSSTENTSLIAEKVLKLSKGDEFYGFINAAAWKDLVGSYDNPYDYYKNNLVSTIESCRLANMLGCKTYLLSSSAAVYSDDDPHPNGYCEDFTGKSESISPYGYTKLVGERIVTDVCKSYGINSYCLRYQNLVGTVDGISIDTSESMFGNIINSICNGTPFKIFGNDWPTEDGTAIRDYVDLQDVVDAHIHFLDLYRRQDVAGNDIVNLGSGVPATCKTVCDIVKSIMGDRFNYEYTSRREGDTVGTTCNIDRLLMYGFTPKMSLEQSILNILKHSNLI